MHICFNKKKQGGGGGGNGNGNLNVRGNLKGKTMINNPGPLTPATTKTEKDI
jgi:hypothetical protein